MTRSKKLGAFVASRRRVLRLSQRKLADAVGKSNSWVSRLEKGGLEPKASTLLRLAAALRVQPQTLLDIVKEAL